MRKLVVQELKKELSGIQLDVSLAEYTFFKIGGPARYFFTAKTKEDLIKAVRAAKELSLPFFILGGGSNLLVSDKGYKGLVINFQFPIINGSATLTTLSLPKGFQSISNSKIFKIVAGAGLPLGKLVNTSAEKGLTGLEWAIGIPGTVGGAIRGNAGAFGTSISDITKTVMVLEIPNPKSQILNKFKILNSKFQIKIFRNKDCKFGYRDSIFKHNENLIILSAEIELKKGDKKEIQKKMRKYLRQRKKSQPLEIPCAGSVFKNYELRIKNYDKLLKINFGFEKFKNKKIIPAGWLIEKSGLKGKKLGRVQISEKHANFIVNLGGGKARDILGLIKLAKKKVKAKFGIELEEEITILNEVRNSDPVL